MFNASKPGRSHLPRFHETSYALFVHLRKRAPLSSWSESLNPALRVLRLRQAVDPSEAESFLDGIVVRYPLFAAILPVVNEPYLGGRSGMFRQPPPPGFPVGDIEGLAYFHRESGLGEIICPPVRVGS